MKVTVELPAAVGIPVTAPVAGLMEFSPRGNDPPNNDHVNGAVPPAVAIVAE
jgi:hypothetical protein